MSGFLPERPVFAILCALAVLSALVSGSIYPSMAVFFTIAVLLCFFISLSGRASSALAVIWPGWLLLGVYYASCLWTVSLNDTLKQSFFLTGLVLFSYLAAFSTRRNWLDTMIKAVFYVSVVVSLYGIYQYAAGFERTEDYIRAYGASGVDMSESRLSRSLIVLKYRRAFSTMLSPNVLACYLAMVLPAGIHLLLKTRTAAGKAAYLIALGLVITAILLTKSVGGFIALVAGLAVFALAMGTGSGGIERLRKTAGLLAVVAVLAAAAGYFVVSERSGGFFGFERSYSERLNYYSGALGAFSDAPMAGNGAGSFHMTYLSRIKPGAGETRFAHNVALQTLSETGVVGFAALMLLFGVYFANCYRGMRDEPGGGIFPALMAGGAAFFAHNMLDYTFYVHETAVMFWLYFGMAASMALGDDRPAGGRSHIPVKAVSAVLAVTFCFYYSKAVLAGKSQSEALEILRAHGITSAAQARLNPPPDDAVGLAEESVSLKPYDDTYRAFLANLYEGAAYSKGPEYAMKAESLYLDAAALNPLYPYHQRDLGILYLKLGRAEDARQRFYNAAILYPASKDLMKLLEDTEK